MLRKMNHWGVLKSASIMVTHLRCGTFCARWSTYLQNTQSLNMLFFIERSFTDPNHLVVCYLIWIRSKWCNHHTKWGRCCAQEYWYNMFGLKIPWTCNNKSLNRSSRVQSMVFKDWSFWHIWHSKAVWEPTHKKLIKISFVAGCWGCFRFWKVDPLLVLSFS